MSQQGVTTAQPPPTPASLRAQIEALQVSLNDALGRRAGIQARIDAAGGRAERGAIINNELRGVDRQIGRLKGEIAGFEAELRQREAIAANPPAQPAPAPGAPAVAPAVAPTATTTVPPSSGIDINAMALGGLATVLVLLPLIYAIARRAGRRAALAARRRDREEDGARLAKMEEAISAMEQQVERVSESQRFLTNALVDDTTRTPVREQVRTRS